MSDDDTGSAETSVEEIVASRRAKRDENRAISQIGRRLYEAEQALGKAHALLPFDIALGALHVRLSGLARAWDTITKETKA